VNDDASLDPRDWDEFRATLHAAADEVVDALASIRSRPAWQPVPDDVKEALRAPIPPGGEPLDATYARFRELIEPYPTGNAHPRFFGWVHGGGSAAGILAELLAAGMNANVGGREHAAVYVERAVVGWFAELFGFPQSASGILTSGTSMGNLLAVVAARDAALGSDAQDAGTQGAPLVAYASPGVHDSVAKALAVAGLGRAALREVPMDRLRERIAADRAAGNQPFLVVATAGSVDFGTFDPLPTLADLCAEEGLWLHVDGAFGALAILSPDHAPLVAGIERADSLAFDLHKWLQAPYAAGCVLFRDEAAHRAPFTSAPAYLKRMERGTGAGAPWYTDYGIELSREFRALKAWFILRHYGPERLGATIAQTCSLAVRLGELVEADTGLELLAPVGLNVVCFRVRPAGLDEEALDRLNAAIAIAVQEAGAAVPSTTRVAGKLALRICIVNHRTRAEDLDVLVAAVRSAAADLTATETFGGPTGF
jgi:glutamate/tyrosine decarboxylase-like PLP-dependent enzyme